MGLSATQARYLALVARQSDLEFQGQQINQSRTTLSDQTNNLYTQLQNMDVPVPPMTQDYTTIEYTTSDGAVKYQLGTIRPSAISDGQYNLDLTYSSVGASLAKSMTFNSVEYAPAQMRVSKVDVPKVYTEPKEGEDPSLYVNTTGIYGSDLKAAGASPEAYMVKTEDGEYVQAESFEDDTMYYLIIDLAAYQELTEEEQVNYTGLGEPAATLTIRTNLEDYYVKTGNGTVSLLDYAGTTKNEDGSYIVTLNGNDTLYKLGGTETIPDPNAGDLMIGGQKALTFGEASGLYGNKINWLDYEQAIKHTFGDDARLEDFYYVVNSNGSTYDLTLFPKEDIPTIPPSGFMAKGYTYTTGNYDESRNYDYVDIQFDSDGRILSISIPTEYDETTGKPVKWKTLDVKSSVSTNNLAYEEAMSQYEYEKYKYDQEQTKINAQISIIQAQDKKLELKLQRLDNERTEIKTEMDALKKVIGDNIDASFKTFSG